MPTPSTRHALALAAVAGALGAGAAGCGGSDTSSSHPKAQDAIRTNTTKLIPGATTTASPGDTGQGATTPTPSYAPDQGGGGGSSSGGASIP